MSLDYLSAWQGIFTGILFLVAFWNETLPVESFRASDGLRNLSTSPYNVPHASSLNGSGSHWRLEGERWIFVYGLKTPLYRQLVLMLVHFHFYSAHLGPRTPVEVVVERLVTACVVITQCWNRLLPQSTIYARFNRLEWIGDYCPDI